MTDASASPLPSASQGITPRLRFEILRRDGFACRYCGATADETQLHVDHLVPRALGGDDHPTNLVAACRDCNLGKGSAVLDSEVVADATESNIRHAQAVRDAVRAIVAEHDAGLTDARSFTEAWERWRDADGDPVPIPSLTEVAMSLRVWDANGLDLESAIALIRVAMERRTVPVDAKFRYFCGVCWNTVRNAAEMASEAD